MKISECKLDSELRLSHFVAQLAKEVGPGMRMEENLNYSVQGLKSTGEKMPSIKKQTKKR